MMSKRCAVLHCPNARRKEKNSVHFFRFPKIEVIMAKWIEATGRENWEPKEYSSICEMHFTPEDYSNNSIRKRLRPDVVPTKFIFAQSVMANGDTLGERKCIILNAAKTNNLVQQAEASNTTQVGKRTNFNILKEIQKKLQKLEEETNNLKEDLQLLVTRNCSINEYLKRQSIKKI